MDGSHRGRPESRRREKPVTTATQTITEDIITQAIRLREDPGPPCGECPMGHHPCPQCRDAIAWRQTTALRDWYGHTALRSLQAGVVSIKHVLKQHATEGGCQCLMEGELTEIRIRAAELDVPEWAEKIAHWRRRLERGEEWTT